MPQSYCNLTYHIVFSTKGQFPWLRSDVRDRVHAYLGGAIRQEKGVALAVGGVEDHIHILAKLHQEKALAHVLRSVKANSSAWIHREFPELAPFAWQNGYGAFTVSASQIEKVRRYITQQDAHHHKTSFREEFEALLHAHGIEYDPKYIWE